MRAQRPAARILLVDGQGRVLLFRFTAGDRPPFWVTPGGALDPGETYAAAARRELREEVGLDRDCGPEVARRVVDFLTVEGVEVTADERYFRVDVDACEVSAAGHTELERQVMLTWRWFPPHELGRWPEPIYPLDLATMLAVTSPLPLAGGGGGGHEHATLSGQALPLTQVWVNDASHRSGHAGGMTGPGLASGRGI